MAPDEKSDRYRGGRWKLNVRKDFLAFASKKFVKSNMRVSLTVEIDRSITVRSFMVFTFVAFSYVLALILTAVLIFFAIWHIIAFDELKNDHKNPIDQCHSLNPLILPEYGTHVFLNVLFLAGAQWFTLFINMPLIAYHMNKFRTRPVIGGFGIYDPATIMNAQTLGRAQREGWIKFGFYILTFFYYIYCMIAELIRQ